MAVTQAIPITRHPYADGSYKKMLIDGKWVEYVAPRVMLRRVQLMPSFRRSKVDYAT
jgi:hypothetical protein